MSFHRYVALGDSFTEGVGDPDPARPNGLRGWADRVAEVPGRRGTEDFGYANLAIRGRKLPAIIADQVEPALAIAPDLVTIHGGGNDILRPRVDLDAPRRGVRRGDRPARRDRREGRDVHDRSTPAARRSTPRSAAGWRSSTSGSARSRRSTTPPSSTCGGCGCPTCPATWTPTGCTSTPPATSTWRCRSSTPSASPTRSSGSRSSRSRSCAGASSCARTPAGPREFLGPWVHRRVTGRSSGDGLTPKHPTLGPDRVASTDVGRDRFRTACGRSSVGRARPSQGRCREFESRRPLHVHSRAHSRPARCSTVQVAASAAMPTGQPIANHAPSWGWCVSGSRNPTTPVTIPSIR